MELTREHERNKERMKAFETMLHSAQQNTPITLTTPIDSYYAHTCQKPSALHTQTHTYKTHFNKSGQAGSNEHIHPMPCTYNVSKPGYTESEGCNTLYCSADPTRCNTLQHTVTHCNTLQHTATHCNTLQLTATHWNTLQSTATYCNTVQHTATHRNTLQHTASYCITLQYTEINWNTLQQIAA